MQLQKTNASNQDKPDISNVNKQKLEGTNQKAKAPNSRLNASPAAKKPPHRSFASNSKKTGRTDWDDSAKLEALRNKNPQKQSCLLYTSPSPRDQRGSRMPSSA